MVYIILVLYFAISVTDTIQRVSADADFINVGKRDDKSDVCPPIPHDCAQECIKYDVPHCRKCECHANPGSGSTSDSSNNPYNMGGSGSNPFDMSGTAGSSGGPFDMSSSGTGGSGSGPFDMSKSGSGMKSGPFDRGQNLYQTPYSSSMLSMGTGPSIFQPISRLGIQGGPTHSWPGIFMRPGSLQGQQACIKGKLVCPEYCLVVDQYGCKTCPCGPASGMLPTVIGGTPVISGTRPPYAQHQTTTNPSKPQKQDNECIGTLVCMLSCKGGYKLGPKGSNGCQPCECTKNKDQGSSNTNNNGGDNKSNATSTPKDTSGSGMTGNSQSGSQQKTGSSSTGGSTTGSSSTGGSTTGLSSTGGTTTGSSSTGGSTTGSGSTGGSTTGNSKGNGFNPYFAGSLMVGTGGSGIGGGMGGGAGGSSGGDCVGPFCASGSGSGSGSMGPMGGSGGKCMGPFCSAASGAGGPFGTSGGSGAGGEGTGAISGSSGGGGGPGMGMGPFALAGGGGNPNKGGSTNGNSMGKGTSNNGGTLGSIPGMNCIGPECSAKNGGSTNVNSMGKGTSNNGGTLGSIPGMNCIGPECSAKNGQPIQKDALTQLFESAGLINNGKYTTSDGQTLMTQFLGLMNSNANTKSLSCPSTDLCKRTCKHIIKLGPKGTDGCPTCSCEITATTKQPQQQDICPEVIRCMMSCDTGYHISSTTNDNECPICHCNDVSPTLPPAIYTVGATRTSAVICTQRMSICIRSCKYGYHLQTNPLIYEQTQCPICTCLPEPTSAPTKRPDIYTVLQNCPEAVHCMTHCHDNGYTLDTIDNNRCPVCKCNQAAVQPLICNVQLNCAYGCSLGYKCDRNGCPTCNCIKPAEIGGVGTQSYIQSSIVCNPQFSCIKKCEYGYRTGQNGCPTCACLSSAVGNSYKVPITGNGNAISLHSLPGATNQHVNSGIPVNHNAGLSTTSNSGQYTNTNHPTLKDLCPRTYSCLLSCPNSYQLHTQEGTICPNCQCPMTNTQVSGSKEDNHTVISLQSTCPNVYLCIKQCPNGYQLTSQDGRICPTCQCFNQVTGNNNSSSTTQNTDSHFPHSSTGQLPTFATSIYQSHTHGAISMGGGKIKEPSTGNATEIGYISTGGSNSGSETGGTTAHNYNGLNSHINNGQFSQLVTSQAVHPTLVNNIGSNSVTNYVKPCIGQSCSTKNELQIVHHGKVEKRPLSLSQCAYIIHCVMSCHHGYKVGPIGEDGCPSCQCIDL